MHKTYLPYYTDFQTHISTSIFITVVLFYFVNKLFKHWLCSRRHYILSYKAARFHIVAFLIFDFETTFHTTCVCLFVCVFVCVCLFMIYLSVKLLSSYCHQTNAKKIL
jgi:hypothetical protein